MLRVSILLLCSILTACSGATVIRFGKAAEKDMAVMDWDQACIVASIDGRDVGLRGTADLKHIKPLLAKLSPGLHTLVIYFEVHRPQSPLTDIIHYTRTITEEHYFQAGSWAAARKMQLHVSS
ncbi:MAG: hypothetical protein CL799_07560 [Chromatiales bacterium]|jgi:hypothetical protein|nr:hypothetical protein [Chromatiales bacterium]MDP6150844.1 hypothetical protein [Gammaproteobacteria bacterium]MDP7271777.1 hypothetical protein [Gammaproteobacteria bacterium]HJP05802.1 hypothetical protein [Gammaproteobacteria bacterium]